MSWWKVVGLLITSLTVVSCRRSSHLIGDTRFQKLDGPNAFSWLFQQLKSRHVTLHSLHNDKKNSSLVFVKLSFKDEPNKLHEVEALYMPTVPGLHLVSVKPAASTISENNVYLKMGDVKMDFNKIKTINVVDKNKRISLAFALQIGKEDSMCKVDMIYSDNKFHIVYNTCPQVSYPSNDDAAKWAAERLGSKLSYLVSHVSHNSEAEKTYQMTIGLADKHDYDVKVKYSYDTDSFSFEPVKCNGTSKFHWRNVLSGNHLSRLRSTISSCKYEASYQIATHLKSRFYLRFPTTEVVARWTSKRLFSPLMVISNSASSYVVDGKLYDMGLVLRNGRECSVRVNVGLTGDKIITRRRCRTVLDPCSFANCRKAYGFAYTIRG